MSLIWITSQVQRDEQFVQPSKRDDQKLHIVTWEPSRKDSLVRIGMHEIKNDVDGHAVPLHKHIHIYVYMRKMDTLVRRVSTFF